MKREIDINEISDGKLYTANDMVRIECQECKGCSECCHGMGESIVLDPYDIYELEKGLQMDFSQLLNQYLELHVVDGMILPNIRLHGEKEQCPFLNKEERCSIHAFRPGFCRLFPLGRIYEDGGFRYFYQINECDYPNKSKVKIKKWLGIPQLAKYEAYINQYHNLLKEFQNILEKLERDKLRKSVNLFFLNLFYVNQYWTNTQETDFYQQFAERLEKAREYYNTIVK